MQLIRMPGRWWKYSKERFPIAAYGMLVVSFYTSHQFLADAVTNPDASMRFDFSSLAGCVTLFCFLLHLRIFDDHKDDQDDCRHFPQRALQRGVVSLRDLKILAAAAMGLELSLSALRGPAALLAVLLAVCYSILMLKEFFARSWLKRHFVTYALTHLLIMPFLSLLVFSFAKDVHFWHAPAWFWLYGVVSFLAASDLEISRKIRDPLHEIAGVDSYTKRFGVQGATTALLLVRITCTLLVTLIGTDLRLPIWFFISLWACFAASLMTGVQYYNRPEQRSARSIEMSAGLYVLACHVLLAVALVVIRGIDF